MLPMLSLPHGLTLTFLGSFGSQEMDIARESDLAERARSKVPLTLNLGNWRWDGDLDISGLFILDISGYIIYLDISVIFHGHSYGSTGQYGLIGDIIAGKCGNI